jgi:hypothetical protein
LKARLEGVMVGGQRIGDVANLGYRNQLVTLQ